MKIQNISQINYKGTNFRLSDASREIIERKLGSPVEEIMLSPLIDNPRKMIKKRDSKKNINNLAYSRNIYLYLGRIFTVEEAEKIISEFGEPWYKRVISFIKGCICSK